MSTETANLLELAISLLATACSVPVRARGPVPSVAGLLGLRAHALGVRRHCHGDAREGRSCGGGVTDRRAERDREQRERREAREDAERRHDQLKEAWRRRRANEEGGKKGRSEGERPE